MWVISLSLSPHPRFPFPFPAQTGKSFINFINFHQEPTCSFIFFSLFFFYLVHWILQQTLLFIFLFLFLAIIGFTSFLRLNLRYLIWEIHPSLIQMFNAKIFLKILFSGTPQNCVLIFISKYFLITFCSYLFFDSWVL